jgi:hypothetical protein
MPIGQTVLPHIPVVEAWLGYIPWLLQFGMCDKFVCADEHRETHEANSTLTSKFGVQEPQLNHVLCYVYHEIQTQLVFPAIDLSRENKSLQNSFDTTPQFLSCNGHFLT